MKTFVKEIEVYEDRKNLLAYKEKTKAQANVGKSKESHKPTASGYYDKASQPKPDEAVIKEA